METALSESTASPESQPCSERFVRAPEREWKHRRLRVPQTDGTLFALPDLATAADQTLLNADLLRAVRKDLQGKSLGELRAWTRDDLLATAAAFTSELTGTTIAAPQTELLIVDGHQPQLFHTGVWAKNFALAGLARRLDAVPLHLIIDNDTFSSSGIRVPAGSADAARLETVPFDAPQSRKPWEEAAIADPNLFDSFGERIAAAMRPWKIDPVIAAHWNAAVEHRRRGANLPVALTAARHSIERAWGLQNLEVPMSRVCRLPSFLWFASHLLAQLPCFVRFYNDVLGEYRRVNHVRSTTHPVPELKSRGDWLEAPFWIWKDGEQQRGRLFARQLPGEIAIAREHEELARLKLDPDADAGTAVEQLQELQAQGYHLRTRALTTTLFARLLLSDLFIHGIGGAKYDEMTDRLFTRFYGVQPPKFVAMSATHRLGIAPPPSPGERTPCDLQTELRKLQFSGEEFLDPDNGPLQQLIAEKQTLVHEQQQIDAGNSLDGTRREQHRRGLARWRRLTEINAHLRNHLTVHESRLRADLTRAQKREHNRTILNSREFSLALFPEPKLREEMQSIEQQAAGETTI